MSQKLELPPTPQSVPRKRSDPFGETKLQQDNQNSSDNESCHSPIPQKHAPTVKSEMLTDLKIV